MAFYSNASNLVEGDSNGFGDVFVHDRVTGETMRVSVASDGTQGNSMSDTPSISADGRYVAFSSYASNLVDGDTNGWIDVFVHDRVTGITELVSVASDGTQGNNYSALPSISTEGRYVTFESVASNLVDGDTNGSYDVFVHDRVTGETQRVSVTSDGTQGNGWSYFSTISADGRYVAFESEATNLVDGDTNGFRDVFVHDRVTGETQRVSVASDGTQGNGHSDWLSSISTDGRYVAFESEATNLVSLDTNTAWDVFVHDRVAGETERVSIASNGTQGNDGSYWPSISSDGRYVAFTSDTTNLVDGDTNGFRDVFVHDREGIVYSISGRITNPSGNPIPGVSISAVPGFSVVTDTSGYYTITNVITGTYTLIPSLIGYTFSPPSRAVSVPPDAMGQDFTGIKKRPVILIPGMGASANWLCFLFELNCDDPSAWDWMPTAEDVYKILINDLEQAGYTQENNFLTIFFYDWRRPLAENIEFLRDRISEVKTATGADQVDLVGHSMGGLVSRVYIQSDIYNYDVAHLITLGSPHAGSALSYPYWEAAYFYRIGPIESIGFNILMRRWLPIYKDIPRVWALRIIIPSFRDILYLSDYLYDEESGDQVIPETEMIHRNTNLATLNAELDLLFARTDVSTFAGQMVSTPARFYAAPRAWWMWPNWDDGEPNWNRESEFMSTFGDETVIASSALLPPPAHTREFVGISHGELPNNPDVIHAITETLIIPMPPLDTAPPNTVQSSDSYLVLAMDGNILTTVTDSLGQMVGPGGVTIPGAKYISDPSVPFVLILIPNPTEGQFKIDIQGTLTETYAVSLLDTFNQPPELITDTLSMWDTAQSQIEPGIDVSFALTYTLETSTTTSIIAVTPIIQTPVWTGSILVEGRALPGMPVEIRDADSQVLIGSGIVNQEGLYEIVLSQPLQMRQRIYPEADGVAGIPVTVQGYTIFVPILRK